MTSQSPSFQPSFTTGECTSDQDPSIQWVKNGSTPPTSRMTAPGPPRLYENSSWTSDAWTTSDQESLAPTYPSTIDTTLTLVPPSSALPEDPSANNSEATLHEILPSAPDGQSSVHASTYSSEQEELDAIRARIRRGRGITGKSIFTALISILANGEYQCIQCSLTYKKLERAIGDQAKHFGFKPYICNEKHDRKTVCGKAFGTKDYLKTHQERQYNPRGPCPACPALITYPRNLSRHMQQVHGHSSPSSTPAKRHRLIGKEALYATMRK